MKACQDCGTKISSKATRCRSCSQLHLWGNRERRLAQSQRVRAQWEDPEIRRKRSEGIKAAHDRGAFDGCCSTEECRQKHSEATAEQWANGSLGNEEHLRKISEAATRQWADPAMRALVTGPNSAVWNRIDQICEICGASFYAKRYIVENRGQGRFCSQECARLAYSDPNHPAWQGGWSIRDYPITFNRKFKVAIRERDHYQCAICRKPAKCIHHINYVKGDTEPENCITLCRACHSKTNFQRAYWKSALGGIMERRRDGARLGIPVYLVGVRLEVF